MALFEQSENSSSRIATSRVAISSRRPRLPTGLVRRSSRETARFCQSGLRTGMDAVVSRRICSAEIASLGDNIDLSFLGSIAFSLAPEGQAFMVAASVQAVPSQNG